MIWLRDFWDASWDLHVFACKKKKILKVLDQTRQSQRPASPIIVRMDDRRRWVSRLLAIA